MGWSNAGYRSDEGGWYKNSVVATGPVKTHVSHQTSFTGTAVKTFTVNIGTPSADRLVVIGATFQTVATLGTISLNSIALTQDAIQNSGHFAAIYTGSGVTFGSGSQTFSLDTGVTSFQVFSIDVWTVTGLLSNTVQSGVGAAAGGGSGGQILNIAAASAGAPALAFCAQSNAGGTSSNFSPSTQAADNTYDNFADNMLAGDWTVTAPNGSFLIRTSGGFDAGAAASYR